MKLLPVLLMLVYVPALQGQQRAGETTDSLKSERRQKVANGLEKGLTYLSYLNYFDRTVDRMRGGIDDYRKYSGKRIANVDVRILKPFGTSLDQPEIYKPNKAERLANKFQVVTREWVIRNKLLFKTGDSVIPVSIADSERDIWDMNAFKDVKVVVVQNDDDTTEVNIAILVRDRFSWSPCLSVAPDKTTAGIEFTNLGGIPQLLDIEAGPVYRADNPYIVTASYSYNNIASSHVNAGATFAYQRLSKSADVEITRNFYSAFSKWAFSVRDTFDKQDAYIPSPYVAAINSKIEYNLSDIWVARSLPFDATKEKDDLRRWVFALRYVHQKYFQRDSLHNSDYSLYYPNNWFVLAAAGFSNWDYYLDKNIYSLGEAEYFNKGLTFALICGPQWQEDLGTRLYSGVRLNHGINFNRVGFWFSELSYGGYINRSSYQQIKLRFRNNVFSAPEKLGKCVVRHFINTSLTFGFLLPVGQEVIVNDDNGLSGFYYNTIRGNRSYSFSYQLSFYPTPEILTFTTCFFAFADLAISGKQAWNDNQFVQAFGVGIRVRSLKLGIDYFRLTFAYYPNLRLPEQKPYNLLAKLTNLNAASREDLFSPGIVSP